MKHSVHIPCWDSFKWNPLKWRGPCFGRWVVLQGAAVLATAGTCWLSASTAQRRQRAADSRLRLRSQKSPHRNRVPARPACRSCVECYWTGLRQTRWARAVYAANLGGCTLPAAAVDVCRCTQMHAAACGRLLCSRWHQLEVLVRAWMGLEGHVPRLLCYPACLPASNAPPPCLSPSGRLPCPFSRQ